MSKKTIEQIRAELDSVNEKLRKQQQTSDKHFIVAAERKKNLTWQANHAKALNKLAGDQDFLNKHAEGIKKRNKGTWRTNLIAGVERRNKEDSAWRTNHANTNKKLFSKSIQTPWGKYESRRQAIDKGLEQGIVNPSGKIDKGIRTKSKEYYYLDK